MSIEGPWTILKVIEWSTGFLRDKGIESPKTEVEILLAHALEVRRIELYVQFERVLDNKELGRFKELLLRRAKREPTAYILGMREFYGIEFDVDRRALIPRPETEHLVDLVVKSLKGVSEPMVCDLCTGCGNVAISVAKTVESARVVATDISSDALALAKQNVKKHELAKRILLTSGDLFEAVEERFRGRFDVIASNPPYVEEPYREKLEPEVAEHEPANALFAGAKGLNVIKRLVADAEAWLKPGGKLVFEIGRGQSEPVGELLNRSGYEEVEFERDYAGIDRVASARKR